MAAILLFLGAGASQPFGLPTMTQMVKKFEEYLKTLSNEKLYSFYLDIKQTLQEGFGESTVDIESIFSVIQGLLDNVKPKDLGHFSYYYFIKAKIDYSIEHETIHNAATLEKELRNFIKNECKGNLDNSKKLEKYKQTYDVLFKELSSMFKLERKSDPIRNEEYYLNWRAFTTNYDSIFEDYWKDLFQINDYFHKPREYQGKHEYFDELQRPADNSLIKLHGSLDWIKLKDHRIMKKNPDEFTREDIEGEVMLFPIQQKDMYYDPWITLFQDLKTSLKQIRVWVIIGYAFNDEFIRNIFEECYDDKHEMILINPDASKIVEKFSSPMQNGIRALNLKFGSEEFSNNFKNELEKSMALA